MNTSLQRKLLFFFGTTHIHWNAIAVLVVDRLSVSRSRTVGFYTSDPI
ncbi:conserved protein of unknown function [Magnetospirillum sp. XM-1]|nr:conserved protein of unknown function [Magnetospirillum sp. XM-1]